MLIQIAQFVLGLSILIVIHEFGHYLPAKWFNVRVSKFYLFFDYKFSLLKKKIGETEWGIGWIPLGGYVKIEGMVDESMDTEQLKDEPEDWEFRAKPAWQRLIILTGGVIMNFLTAYFIFVFLLMTYGKEYLPNENLTFGIKTNILSDQIGLQDGDKIIQIGNNKPQKYRDLANEILLSVGENILVNRNGNELEIPITAESINQIFDSKEFTEGKLPIIERHVPVIISKINKGSTAEKFGLAVGDSIVGINGQESHFGIGLREFQNSIVTNSGNEISLQLYRDGAEKTLSFAIPKDSLLGVQLYGDAHYYDYITEEYSFGKALVGGWQEVGGFLNNYIRQFKLIFNFETEAYKQVGGFAAIMKGYDGSSWNWRRFWEFTALLSIMLGFLNILPIPALDGGHVVFTLIEMISGRRPPVKVLEIAQMIGFFLLLALLIFANGQDIIRAVSG